jgi:hypothetical protein
MATTLPLPVNRRDERLVAGSGGRSNSEGMTQS